MGVLYAKVGGAWVPIAGQPMLGGGLVALAVGTASSYTNGTATETAITVTAGSPPSLTLALDPSRRYKAVYHARFSHGTANTAASFRFRIGGVTSSATLMFAGPIATNVHFEEVFTPATSAAVTYDMLASLPGATGTLSAAASAASPMMFWIEDLSGPQATTPPLLNVTSSTRPPLAAGQRIWESDTKRALICDGTGWIIEHEPWQNYTPSLSGINLGTTGSVTGIYQRRNGSCHFFASAVLGGTGFAITTNPALGLPFTAVGLHYGMMQASAITAGSTLYPLVSAQPGASLSALAIVASGTYATHATINGTVPFTWAAGDRFSVGGFYQMSSPYS